MTIRSNGLLFAVFAWLLLQAAAALAVTPDEMLADPAMEARAREISQDLRCVVCPNQSIDDSNAPLAKDLRVLIRDRLKSGDSNSQAVDFIVARYGNFVLLRPPVQPNTLLLWFAPALLAGVVLLQLLRYLRHQQAHATGETVGTTMPKESDDLSAEETRRMREILAKGSMS